MKAAFFDETGSPDVIHYGDLPDPAPQPTQVLVRVRAVSVNPIDTYIRSGKIPLPLPMPYIIGRDLAGVVEQCGSQAKRFRPGDRVWCVNQGKIFDQGLSSELAAVEESWLLPIPDAVDFKDAAAIALVGSTAWLGLFDKAGLQKGETLFVNGGSGGVGSAVVQMAKAAGARVITTAGSPEKAGKCRELGADEVILYKERKVGDELKHRAPDGIHVWYETLASPDLETSIPALTTGGRMILMAGRDAHPTLPLGLFYTRDCRLLGLVLFNASVEAMRRAGEAINQLMSKGQLRSNIDREMPLAKAADAHRIQEENTVGGKGTLAGKIVLTLR